MEFDNFMPVCTINIFIEIVCFSLGSEKQNGERKRGKICNLFLTFEKFIFNSLQSFIMITFQTTPPPPPPPTWHEEFRIENSIGFCVSFAVIII